jgi:hypothetical protein
MEKNWWHLVYNFSSWSQSTLIDCQPFNFWFSCSKNNNLSNKIVQGVDITHMEEELFPCKYGMEVTSHHDPISYGKLVLTINFIFLGFCCFIFLSFSIFSYISFYFLICLFIFLSCISNLFYKKKILVSTIKLISIWETKLYDA